MKFTILLNLEIKDIFKENSHNIVEGMLVKCPTNRCGPWKVQQSPVRWETHRLQLLPFSADAL